MMNDSSDFSRLMQEGSALHRSGSPEQAVVCFERALALEPGNANAASACATMFTLMGQPQAAYRVLIGVQQALLQNTDGATNLGIAAEACGHTEQALAAYQRALELDPDNWRALNNTALLSAQQGDFDTAILRMQRCTELSAQDPAVWSNLADMQIAARRFQAASDMLGPLVNRFATDDGLAIRHVLALAFHGDIDEAQAAIAALPPARKQALAAYLVRVDSSAAKQVRKRPSRSPDAYDLFCQQAFEAIEVCDWRDHERVTSVIREMLARAARTGRNRDWRDVQFFALTLPLLEDEQNRLRVITASALRSELPAAPAPAPALRRADQRLRIGLAALDLRDPRNVNALEQQLALHDATRFAMHVYSSMPQQSSGAADLLAQRGVRLVEIGHMTSDEAVGRIRLDGLDLYMDMAYYTPLCRPEITVRRVAPVQIRQTTWHRHHPVNSCAYNIVDRFVFPDALDAQPYGAVVRFPHTCWLSTNTDGAQAAPPARAELGLPQGGMVLCALVPPLMVDPQTFALWMDMLRNVPDAVLWLPSYPPLTRKNLAASARAAGIDAARIVYLPHGSRAQTLARIQAADLFVDPLRFNANYGLVDALRMGVPALSCAGNNMASRLGGSIIRSAGLPECVFETPDALLQRVVALGTDRLSLAALRQRLAQQRASAALFDAPARVREWEWAWNSMVERHRAGLAPAAFDVPPQAQLKT